MGDSCPHQFSRGPCGAGARPGAQLDATRLASQHFLGRAGGASTPGLFCCSGTQEGLGRRGAAKASTGQAGGTAVPLPSPSALRWWLLSSGTRPCPPPDPLPHPFPGPLPASSTAASLPDLRPPRPNSSQGAFPASPRAPGCLPTRFSTFGPKRTCKAAGSRAADLPWVVGRFCKCSAALTERLAWTRPWEALVDQTGRGPSPGPVPRTLRPQCSGHGLNPWSGN